MTQPVREPTPERDVGGLDWRTRQLARRPAQRFRIAAIYHIKVRSNRQFLIVRDDEFTWAIEEDIDGMMLSQVEIDVTTVSSSGLVEVQLRNVDNGNADMLSTTATIDVGETHSRTAATPPVVNGANAGVSHGDRIAIDVDQKGTGAKGLGLVAVFVAPV